MVVVGLCMTWHDLGSLILRNAVKWCAAFQEQFLPRLPAHKQTKSACIQNNTRMAPASVRQMEHGSLGPRWCKHRVIACGVVASDECKYHLGIKNVVSLGRLHRACTMLQLRLSLVHGFGERAQGNHPPSLSCDPGTLPLPTLGSCRDARDRITGSRWWLTRTSELSN